MINVTLQDPLRNMYFLLKHIESAGVEIRFHGEVML